MASDANGCRDNPLDAPRLGSCLKSDPTRFDGRGLDAQYKDVWTWTERPYAQSAALKTAGERKVVVPVSHDVRLEVQAVLAMVIVGRRVYQPGKERSGYVIFAIEAAGHGIGEPHSVKPDSKSSYTVVFPPSTDPSHKPVPKPCSIPDAAWSSIFRDIEPCTRFDHVVSVPEHHLDPGRSPVDLARLNLHLRPLLDLRCGQVLFEVGDIQQKFPIYIGRHFIEHAPVEPHLRGYDVGVLPSHSMCHWVVKMTDAALNQGSDDDSDMYVYSSDEEGRQCVVSTQFEAPPTKEALKGDKDNATASTAARSRKKRSGDAAKENRAASKSGATNAAKEGNTAAKATKADKLAAAAKAKKLSRTAADFELPKPLPGIPNARLTAAKLAAARGST